MSAPARGRGSGSSATLTIGDVLAHLKPEFPDLTISKIRFLEGEGLVAFRYVGVNPNGSLDDIAGLTNARGNVVGLMPHPEHASEPGFGPDTPAAMRSGVDGLTFFTSVLTHTLASV